MGLKPRRFFSGSGYCMRTLISCRPRSTMRLPTFGTGSHCPGVGSRRRSPFVATRSPFWMTPTPPWWLSG